jgi:N-acetyl-gamma-glutamyl-phosphate reductase
LLRLIAGHPDFELVAATAHGRAGAPITSVHPHLRRWAGLAFAPTTPESLADADLVFLALPHGVSDAIATDLPPSVKVVDLGSDHRLSDAVAYDRYYGGRRPETWTYGLPELPGQRTAIRAASRVANTGCYAVATILALAPLIAAATVEVQDVVVVAASGTSGAGRDPQAHLLGSEVMGDVWPYKVGAHRHVPEICEATGARTLTMTPLLAPMPRGILATVTAVPTRPVTAEAVHDVLATAYAEEAFVHVLPVGTHPHTAATFGSNSAHLGVAVDLSSGRVIVTSAIDNLGKGAAGQAVQNANLMLGLDEAAGLSMDGVAP